MDNVDNVVIDEFVLDFPKKGFSQVALSVYFNERDSIQGVRHYIKQNLNGNHVIAPSNLPNQIDCYNFIIDNYNAGESNVVTAKVFLPSPLKKLTWPRSCPT